MLTPAAPAELRDRLTRQNLLAPREFAAKLLYNHASQDWRDRIPRISLPALVIGGRASLIPCAAATWTARHIPAVACGELGYGGAHGRWTASAAGTPRCRR